MSTSEFYRFFFLNVNQSTFIYTRGIIEGVNLIHDDIREWEKEKEEQ